MDALVQNVFDFLEYFVVGFVGLVALSFSVQVREFWSSQLSHLIGDKRRKESVYIRVTIFIVLAFLMGLLVDSATYFVVHQYHKYIIHTVVVDYCGDEGQSVDVDYKKNFYLERIWEEKGKTYGPALSRVLKDIRMVRGIGLILFLVGAVYFIIAVRKREDHAVLRGCISWICVIVLTVAYQALEVRYHRHVWASQVNHKLLEEGKKGCNDLPKFQYSEPTHSGHSRDAQSST